MELKEQNVSLKKPFHMNSHEYVFKICCASELAVEEALSELKKGDMLKE